MLCMSLLAACSGEMHQPVGAHELDDDFKGCPEGIADFGPGLRAEGKQFALEVVSALPAEPERYRNDWTVVWSALEGEQSTAEITRAQTFMPIHGHDGRVEPEIDALPMSKQIAVSDLNFTMRGPWEVRFWLRSPAVEDDYVVFKVCVAK